MGGHARDCDNLKGLDRLRRYCPLGFNLRHLRGKHGVYTRGESRRGLRNCGKERGRGGDGGEDGGKEREVG